MLDARAFLSAARAHGYDFVVGVPCSFMTPLIDCAIAAPDLRYVGATSEGEAMAIAAGAWLAGRKAIVMLQNSGLGNAVNPLTSLNTPFRIPCLMLVSWRGRPGMGDEPQHAQMGAIMHGLLDLMGIAHSALPATDAELAPALARADASMEHSALPYALVVKQGDFAEAPMRAHPPRARASGRGVNLTEGGTPPPRAAALRTLLDLEHRAAVIASTGKGGRELFTLDDRRQHLYQVGSMGCASAMGLGLALHTARRVLVLDGDGAALMKLGNLATIGACAPARLIHILLDNGVHDSTGGQPTVSSSVAFADVALACGYALAATCDSVDGLRTAYAMACASTGPTLIHLRIAPGSMTPLARPTLSPDVVARRLQTWLGEAA